MTNRYPLNIEWSDEDEEFIATCPAFPELSAFGVSEEEAVSEAKIALQGFVDTYNERGMPLPEVATRSSFSGKLHLRLAKTLHSHASRMAQAERVSLNTFIADAVQARVAGLHVSDRILFEIRNVLKHKLPIGKTTKTQLVQSGQVKQVKR